MGFKRKKKKRKKKKRRKKRKKEKKKKEKKKKGKKKKKVGKKVPSTISIIIRKTNSTGSTKIRNITFPLA